MDFRRPVVEACRSGLTASYEAAATMFGIGRATVSRILRRDPETGDVAFKARGGNRTRVIEDAWLIAQAEAAPDARLIDRVFAWLRTAAARSEGARCTNRCGALAGRTKNRCF